jgi:16S rRNA (guanine966-N2)-methyltransferase
MVPGEGTRPIGDRVKESLFNILRPRLPESHFLDLFAGTGSVGIEALSQGAAKAVFVDTSARAIRTIHENLKLTGFGDRAEVIRGDAFEFLHAPRREAFDLIYVAPPQYRGLWERAVGALDETPVLLNPDGWVICQVDPVEFQLVELRRLSPFDQRRYGSTLLWFLEFPGPGDGLEKPIASA